MIQVEEETWVEEGKRNKGRSLVVCPPVCLLVLSAHSSGAQSLPLLRERVCKTLSIVDRRNLVHYLEVSQYLKVVEVETCFL